jgi:hypothetical protein
MAKISHFDSAALEDFKTWFCVGDYRCLFREAFNWRMLFCVIKRLDSAAALVKDA